MTFTPTTIPQYIPIFTTSPLPYLTVMSIAGILGTLESMVSNVRHGGLFSQELLHWFYPQQSDQCFISLFQTEGLIPRAWAEDMAGK